MILYLDTTDFNKAIFALSTAGKKTIKRAYKIDPRESHETLARLEDFLKRFKIQDLRFKRIIVNKGPGSYTGTRVGVAIAQALGLTWNVPVKFLSKDKFIIK